MTLHLLSIRSALLSALLIVLPGAVSATTLVRVAHLSPDAPSVDVRVDGEVVLSSLTFRTVSAYLPLEPGAREVVVTPAGAIEPEVIRATLELEAETAYTVAATGLLGDEDLAAVVLVDDRDASPESAKVRLLHASPDAPPVDVALAGGDVLIANVAFRGSSDYLTVPAGDYELEVRVAGTETVALSLGTVSLLGGTNYEFLAAGLLADDTLEALPVVTYELPTRPALVRVAHLSPDAPEVDVWVDGEVVLSDVPFRAFSEYLPLGAGEYRVQVTPAGASEPVVVDALLPVDAGVSYTVAATGLLAAEDLAPIVLVDDRVSSATQAKVRFVHTAPDAPAVDVAVVGGPTLFAAVPFRGLGATLEVSPGSYDLEVRVAGTSDVALSLPGVELSAGVNLTVFATGLLADESLAATPAVDVDDRFVRGDTNRDGRYNVSDAVATLRALFVAPIDGLCRDAADANDDGHLTLTDAVYSLNYLFQGGSRPAMPYPEPGTDTTDDRLGCTFSGA